MADARVQNRHGAYSDYNKNNILADEIAIIDSGYPDTLNLDSAGAALLYKPSGKDPVRVLNAEELENDLGYYYTKSEIDSMIGDIETLLSQV